MCANMLLYKKITIFDDESTTESYNPNCIGLYPN